MNDLVNWVPQLRINTSSAPQRTMYDVKGGVDLIRFACDTALPQRLSLNVLVYIK